MANFIFNSASAAIAAATLDLSTGNYYAHLVTTVPALGHSTVADLVLPTTSSYASTPLTGLSYNSTRWTFNSFSFPKYSFVSAPTGVVICRRSGANPTTTDAIVCYSDFNNSIGQVINLQVGVYVVNLQFGSNGAINFAYRYQYNSGAFNAVESESPKGLFFLIGSRNNTVTFSSPSPAKIEIVSDVAVNSLINSGYGSYNGAGIKNIYIDFKDLSIKNGIFSISNLNQSFSTTSIVASIYCSNLSRTALGSNIYQPSSYTAFQSGALTGTSRGFLNFNASSYFRSFLITLNLPNSLFALGIMEFFSTPVLSPTINMV